MLITLGGLRLIHLWISCILVFLSSLNFKCQGVKLRLIQVPMQLNFSLWQPNPES